MMERLSMKCSIRKASLAILVAAALIVVPACGSANRQTPTDAAMSTTSTSAGQSTTLAPTESGGTEFTLPPNGKYDPAITMTTVGAISPSMAFRDGETMENNVHTRWASDRFGINLKYLWSSTTQNNAFLTRMRLALSANEAMPDVVAIDNVQLANSLIDSGKFREVKSLWEDLASQGAKDAINQDPTMWYPYMRDDGGYGIPIPENSKNNDTILFIRTDWLKKLNLEAPTTLTEMETVMDAFVNQDPDGNGQKDTLGIAISLRDSMRPVQATGSFIFGAFGYIPYQWNVMEDGTLGYGSVQPGAKQALATLADWMAKGYIHQEAGIQDEAKSTELFTSGKAGMIAGPMWMDRTPLKDVMKNIEGADFSAFKIPTGPDGMAARLSTLNFRGAVLINKDYEHPEAFVLYDSYLFDNFAPMKKGTEFEYGFAEGYDYVFKPNGDLSYDTKDIPGGRIIAQKFTITYEGARIPTVSPDAVQLALDTLDYLEAGNPPRNNIERKTALFNDTLRYRGQRINLQSADYSRQEMFTGTPTPTMQSKMEYLNTMELETFTKIIYGDLPVDDFDKFVQEWKTGGGDDITKEVNEWYTIASGK